MYVHHVKQGLCPGEQGYRSNGKIRKNSKAEVGRAQPCPVVQGDAAYLSCMGFLEKRQAHEAKSLMPFIMSFKQYLRPQVLIYVH